MRSFTPLVLASLTTGCFTVPELRQCYNDLDCQDHMVCSLVGTCEPSDRDASVPDDAGIRCEHTDPIEVHSSPEFPAALLNNYDLSGGTSGRFAYVMTGQAEGMKRRIYFNTFNATVAPSEPALAVSSTATEGQQAHIAYNYKDGEYVVSMTDNGRSRVEIATIDPSSRDIRASAVVEDITVYPPGHDRDGDHHGGFDLDVSGGKVAIAWRHHESTDRNAEDNKMYLSLYESDLSAVNDAQFLLTERSDGVSVAYNSLHSAYGVADLRDVGGPLQIEFSAYAHSPGQWSKVWGDDYHLGKMGSSQPDLAATRDGFGVVWVQEGSEPATIYYREIDLDLGASNPVAIAPGSAASEASSPSIAVLDSGLVGVVWSPGVGVQMGTVLQKSGPRFSLISNRGEGLFGPLALSTSEKTGPAQIVASGNGFGVLWREETALKFSKVICESTED